MTKKNIRAGTVLCLKDENRPQKAKMSEETGMFEHKTPSLLNAVSSLGNMSAERVEGLISRIVEHHTEGYVI